MTPKWAFTFALLASLLMGCDTPRTPLDGHDIALAAKRLAAVSAEGELLAGQVRAHRVSREFAWVHQQALGEEAQQVAQQLQRLAPEPLRPGQQRLLALHTRFQQNVYLIADVRGRPDELARLAQQFRQISVEAAAVEQPA